MNLVKTPLAIILAALLTAQITASVQMRAAGQNGTATLQAYARNVVLDVVVTDANGTLVRDLHRDDFEVLEDGTPERIVDFESPGSNAIDPRAVVHSTADLDAISPRSPVTIIVLDEINTTFEDMAFARYSLHHYLEKQPQRLDQPTMLVAVGIDRFTALLDYTQDKRTLLRVLDRHFVQYPWHLDSSWNNERFASAFTALMQVGEATIGHPGHKNLIWVGRGFPTVDPMQVTVANWEKLQQLIRRCINELRDARITLYTIDPAGIPKSADPDDESPNDIDPFGGSVQFAAVAEATGGRAFYGRNDVDGGIGSSIRDGDGFYTITYMPPAPDGPGQSFRRVRIRLRDPHLHAVTREGYYLTAAVKMSVPNTAVEGKQSRLDLLAAANTTLVYDGLPLTIKRMDSAPYKITVQLPSASITQEPRDTDQERTAHLEVLIEIFDRKNKILSSVVKEITAAFATPEEGKESPSNLYFHLGLPRNASAARLRVVVRLEGSGKVGALNLDLRKNR